MYFLKRIFGFIWALWGAFWFMVIIIPFTLLYAVVLGIWGKKYSMYCVWINCRVLVPVILKLCLIRVKIHGAEKIDKKRTYVFVANHLTQMDILTTAYAVPKPIRFLAKMETRHIPFFGYMVKMLAIVVDRKSKESRDKAYRYMADAIGKGECLFIYPEGTRNRTPEPVKEFKDGAFRVAVMAQAPIAVQTLVGMLKVNPPQGLQLYPGTVEVFWSEPFETQGTSMEYVSVLKEKVKNEMLKHLS
jgi:1-acyl-sn-glycerol-3-phosphate acyltransferase